MQHPVIAAQLRTTKGKGAARKLRREKKVPAVFYGPGGRPVLLTVNRVDMESLLRNARGDNVILDLKMQSEKGTETRRAMLKELQTDPVKDNLLHADFYEISMDKEITVEVPIRLVNTPAGVTQGGILQHVRRELTVSCLPGKLVDRLEVDVSGLDIGDSLHVRDIPLPDGVRSEDDGDLTVAVVVAPTVRPEEVEEAAPEAEEEVTAEEETPEES